MPSPYEVGVVAAMEKLAISVGKIQQVATTKAKKLWEGGPAGRGYLRAVKGRSMDRWSKTPLNTPVREKRRALYEALDDTSRKLHAINVWWCVEEEMMATR
jgi:hypothetical protein